MSCNFALDGRAALLSSNQKPAFGTCCDDGQVHVPTLRDPPAYLRGLFEDLTPEAIVFRTDIRPHDVVLTFTSPGAQADHDINHGRRPYVFRIHEELWHRSGALIPLESHQPMLCSDIYTYI
ncbi:hypothetical protein DFH29DRAFT_799993 [Suillus ampliporus]|nr:hypothetical protein DFH29DRAFT_799993 [Suillus ampliporus]